MAEPTHPGGRRRVLLAGSVDLALLSYAAGLTLLGPLVAPMAAELGVSEAKIGALPAWISVGFLAVIFFVGPWADRVGLKPPSLLGQLLMAAGLGTTAAAPDYAVAGFGMAVFGAGGALCDVIANATVADLYPRRRTTALNVAHVFFGLGAVLGPRLAGHLAAGSEDGWRTAFSVVALIGVAVVPLYLALPFPRAQPYARVGSEIAPPAGNRRALMRGGVLPALILAMFFYIGAETGVSVWGVLFLERAHGWSKVEAAAAISNFWLMITGARIVVSALSLRVRPEPLLIGLAAGASVMLGLFAFVAEGEVALMVTLLGAGAFVSGIFATIFAEAANLVPHRSASVSGFLMASAGVALMTLVPAVGWLAGHVGIARAFLLEPGFMVLSLLCVILAVFRARALRRGVTGNH